MGPSEKEICIKCDKGGEVLVCSDSCCPIAVHAKCLGCPARFDDLGKFYCPYCLYRQSIAKFHQAKEHVLSKKQALHTFIDKEMIDNVREVPSIVSKSTCERADETLPEKKSDVPESNCRQQWVVGQQIHSGPDVDYGSKPSVRTSSKATPTNFRVVEAGNDVQVNDLQEFGERQLERSAQDHHPDGHLSNSSIAEDEVLGNELVLAETKINSEIAEEQMIGVDQTTAIVMNTDTSLQQHFHGKRRAETGYLTCGESKRVSTQHECGKQVYKVKDELMLTDSPTSLTRTSASLLENTNAAAKFVQVKKPSMLFPVMLPNGKRRRVLWRPEEEEMIEEGVQKFSSTVNKNIPWRKILDFGHHVFDHTRTPADLKDKWKQICSKYGGRV